MRQNQTICHHHKSLQSTIDCHSVAENGNSNESNQRILIFVNHGWLPNGFIMQIKKNHNYYARRSKGRGRPPYDKEGLVFCNNVDFFFGWNMEILVVTMNLHIPSPFGNSFSQELREVHAV